MAALVYSEAPRLPNLWKLAGIYLLVASLFVRNSLALIVYTRQHLLDIGLQQSHIATADHLIPSEIARTPGTTTATRPAGRAPRPGSGRKHRRGARGGVRTRLQLKPHRQALPSLFLAAIYFSYS